ncbi:hypothetical protein DFH08DRAFT_960902 [Mycena albidolilacea]|uniref:Uncharacterized protein n=1 Tax=Mycena albidolilacea TaxID=1033008 RepID=A0AAD7A1H5_9AGAR|nr:hypothetical protein DFH08DRAFT_960902 [Mycena albidolilacea]
MSPKTQPAKPSTGPPQALLARIKYLGQLLKHLPSTIPENPSESPYRFYLNEDRIADTGTVFPEAGQALEISFGTWKSRDAPVIFSERGRRLQALVPFLKNVVKRMNTSERSAFKKSWIDRLVKAAKDCGAAIPSKTAKRRAEEGATAGDESDAAPPPKKSKMHAPIILGTDSDSPNAQSSHPSPAPAPASK